MVDTGDLKSPGHCVRAGSSPAPGTTIVWIWCHRQAVRPQPAKLLSPVQIRVAPPLSMFFNLISIRFYFYREMSEWSNVPVLKTGEGNTSGGSNPPLPASFNKKSITIFFLFFCSIYLRIKSVVCNLLFK